MLVEAEDKRALARGMQGFQISAARNINTVLGDKYRRRRGTVFADRYHVVLREGWKLCGSISARDMPSKRP